MQEFRKEQYKEFQMNSCDKIIEQIKELCYIFPQGIMNPHKGKKGNKIT